MGRSLPCEADGDGGSQQEEDSLDDDESRSVDSDSTGSLADFIAPDWEMESGDEGEAAEDDDYENESTDENEEAGDGGDDRPKRAYLPNCDAMARLEMIAYNLRRLAHAVEGERPGCPRRSDAPVGRWWRRITTRSPKRRHFRPTGGRDAAARGIALMK
ncbi:hypothetical protein MY4038_009443 [Beauveria bassiana]